ncbi:MAG: tetratricopeptide repeat protein, partial [Rhodospirillaceae bacterium]|nr:tetratricopeptide repeat protein [Rhodospirillaceae bacterium]
MNNTEASNKHSNPGTGEAESAYKRALEHHKNGRLLDAVREYSLTVRLSPYSPEAYNNFGVALRALGRVHGAVACYRRSLGIRPRSASVLTNLGNAFRDLGMIKRSIAAHERALKITPISANAHFNAALAFRDGGKVELALEHFQKALALDPANIEIKMEIGISLLRAGEWKEGLQLLEARLKIPRFANKRNDIQLWQKQSLNGKIILVTYEGSPGTLIMMSRFARNLKLAGAKVIMEAPEKAVPLLRLSPDIDEVVNIGASINNADYQVGLLSIPERLGITINNIPGETPYLRPGVLPAHEL